ncbi:UvrD-helicase domain-containing protein [Rhodoferax mekongensis]|uniref:DNA 3'-5' helicase n=1 Tax=Rhodoferax mekongensis TaxID=3068341 RepID=A0ABZ0AWX5_9BURK|nr:UvrD-helicase domain-containing protein [Rhodoferax sp. TBRC 17307]WNO03999.1 UvrD-helicase domain-containing protein [Rhodoferax sp. TBRC 17307]
MSPFEVARLKARELHTSHSTNGDLYTNAFALVNAVCSDNDIVVRQLAAGHPLLNASDAVIRVEQKRVVVRKDLDVATKAFLIAHELGHFFLHQGTGASFELSASESTGQAASSAAERVVDAYGPRERQELQANVFARELLLPRELAVKLFQAERLTASSIASKLEIPLEVSRLQLVDALLLPDMAPRQDYQLPAQPTEDQSLAVNSPHRFTLVEAGPGTGKTTALLFRVKKLLNEGVSPSGIVVLTFSNKAAGELLSRLKSSGLKDAQRMWVGTFHAFGLEFLRKFGNRCGLDTNIQVLNDLGAINILESVLPTLELTAYDVLRDPIGWLPDVLKNIRRCKDDLIDSETFALAVESATGDVHSAKRTDTAQLFRVYEKELRAKSCVDFQDLISLPIQVLAGGYSEVESFARSITHVLVDEYQDVNRASATLVKSLVQRGSTLWAVGDAFQAIYAFMGASSRNLKAFEVDFPGAERIPLGANHRSHKELTDVFHKISTNANSRAGAVLLHAVKGESGLAPTVFEHTKNGGSSLSLPSAIKEVSEEVRFGQQAVLVMTNEMAAQCAQSLERQGIPVLFLGKVHERPEVKDLMRLMQLSVDEKGAGLGGDWDSVELRLSQADLQKIGERSADLSWWDADGSCLSAPGQSTLSRLKMIVGPLRAMTSPWEALCHLLFEVHWFLSRFNSAGGQSSINAKLALWQFVHSSRSPDGLSSFATIRSFRDKVRKEIKLGLVGQLSNVPPEAEHLNAVHILTIYKSKGLEFDCVHLLEITKKRFDKSSANNWPLIPSPLLNDMLQQSEEDAFREQYLNLLYVAFSRARKHLFVHKDVEVELPSSISSLGLPVEKKYYLLQEVPDKNEAEPFRLKEITLEDLVMYRSCPRQVLLTHTVGRVPRGQWTIAALTGALEKQVLSSLYATSEARSTEAVGGLIFQGAQALGLADNIALGKITSRIQALATQATRLLAEPSEVNVRVSLAFPGGEVHVLANQMLTTSQPKFRLIRRKEANVDELRQALGALLKIHSEETGKEVIFELVDLTTGEAKKPTGVKPPTVTAYKQLLADLGNGLFAPEVSEQTCNSCNFFIHCHQGRR